MLFKIKNKIGVKLIFTFILFATIIIFFVLYLLYLNLNMKIENFNKKLINKNHLVLMNMINSSKERGKEVILENNNKVVAHTKEQLNNFIKKASKEQNLSILKTVALAIELELKSVREILLNIADSPAFYWQYDVKEKEVLTNLLRKDDYFDGFIVLFESGEILMKVGYISENIDLRKIYAKNKLKEIYISNIDKNSNFYIGVPIINESGKYRGSLIAKIRIRRLLSYIFNKIDLGVDKTIFILDRNQLIIKHKDETKEGRFFQDINFDKNKEFSQYISEKQDTIYNIFQYNKEFKFFIIVKEYISDSFSYVDTLKADAEKIINESFVQFDTTLKEEVKRSYQKTNEESRRALEDFAKEIVIVLYFVIIISIVVAIVIGIILANYITKPIKELSNAAKNIGDGNLDYEIDSKLKHEKDEIGLLAKEFSEMQVKIKNSIEQIRELERKKAHAERLSVMGQIASGIVHEIKNPLTSISGYAQIINEIAEDAGIKNNAKVIIDETDRLNKLTLELLDYAKPSKINKTQINVENFIRENIEILYPKAMAKKVGINLDFGDNLGFIEGDKDKIKQVFINIISNGIEAVETVKGLINVNVNRKGSKVIFEIRDNGPGIPKNIRDKLFMPFVTSKKNGTGLGLAMVKKIIDEHGGEITIETSEKGTCFIIILYSKLNLEE